MGVLGAGKHARAMMIPGALFVDGLKVTCAMTRTAESAQTVRDTFDLPCGTDAAEVLEQDIDAVLIGAPWAEHVGLVQMALEAGKHVFCETPCLRSSEEAPPLQGLAAQGGLVVMVGWCLAHSPLYQKVKALTEELSEDLEEKRCVYLRYFGYLHHTYNLAAYLLGPVKSVFARAVDKQKVVTLDFESGDLGSVIGTGFPTTNVPCERVDVSTSKWLVQAEYGEELRVIRDIPSEDQFEGDFDSVKGAWQRPSGSIVYRRRSDMYRRGYLPELEEFVRCVRAGEEPRSNLAATAHTAAIIQAEVRSLTSGQPESVST